MPARIRKGPCLLITASPPLQGGSLPRDGMMLNLPQRQEGRAGSRLVFPDYSNFTVILALCQSDENGPYGDQIV